jgi:hypothetical protein
MPHKARLAEIVNTFSVKELYNKIMSGRESKAEPFFGKSLAKFNTEKRLMLCLTNLIFSFIVKNKIIGVGFRSYLVNNFNFLSVIF